MLRDDRPAERSADARSAARRSVTACCDDGLTNEARLGRPSDMQFAETEEQSMIREMVRDFAEDVLGPTCLTRDKAQQPPIEEWRQFCDYGLQSITIPEQYGGNPVDDVSEAIIIEELARVDPSFSVFYAVHVGLCCKTITLHGSDEQMAKYLPMLAADKIGAYSLSEAGAGTDAAAMSCKAKLSDDGSHLSGGTAARRRSSSRRNSTVSPSARRRTSWASAAATPAHWCWRTAWFPPVTCSARSARDFR